MNDVPYVSLYSQLENAFQTLQVSNMKSVDHEDNEFNSDFSVDPLSDPRLDKMDLFNMVDSKDRDAIMNSTPSFDVGPGDAVPSVDANDSNSESGSGE